MHQAGGGIIASPDFFVVMYSLNQGAGAIAKSANSNTYFFHLSFPFFQQAILKFIYQRLFACQGHLTQKMQLLQGHVKKTFILSQIGY